MGTWVAPTPRAEALLERPARGAANRAATAVLAAALLVATIALAGAAMGYRGVTILSGSMEPSISTGDLVVADTIRASQMRVGDVVTFRSEAGFSITHRVSSVTAKPDGSIAVTTKGDANPVPERWSTPPDATVGRVVATLPQVGAITRWTSDPTGRLLVLGAIAVLGAGVALRRIWSD
jgi:signal peptidase